MGGGGGWWEWGAVEVGGGGVGGWRVGSQGQAKATIEVTDSSSVCPVSGTSSHNPQDRPRLSLAAV